MQHGYKIKLSTRSQNKQRQLSHDGFDSYVVDIDQADLIDTDFFNADALIVNITNKNITSFEKLIQAVNKSPIKQVLFVSSSSVYQNLNRAVTEDEGAENTDSPLFQIETLFKKEHRFTTTVIRFSGLIGPDRHPGRFFRHGKQVQQADSPVNLIHLSDCIGIISAVFSQSAWQQTFNGCADTHPSKREFYTQACRSLNRPVPDFMSAQLPAFKIVSNDKIKDVLHYQLHYPNLQMLDETWFVDK